MDEYVGFVADYYKARYVPYVLALLCWKNDVLVQLSKRLSEVNIRSQIISPVNVSIDIVTHDEYHPIGIVLDVNCDFGSIFDEVPHEILFNGLHRWLLIDERDDNKSIELLETLNILPNSDVVLNRGRQLTNVYKIYKDMPLKFTDVDLNKSSNDDRRDFEGIFLKCATVITEPKLFTDMYDLRTRHVDTWTKSNYPLLELLADDLNFKFDIERLDNFGWEINGSFDGLMGKLQRREIEFGATGAFMRTDRMKACDFAAATFNLRACIIFRQPMLSTIMNIFQLPFARGVWIACGCIFAFIGVALCAEFKIIHRYISDCDYLTVTDLTSFVIGAFCQQGFHKSSTIISVRIIFLVTFVASVFLYTSYSANIVALLQRPSTSIKTISDLALSPLKIGIQNTTYNRVFLKESTEAGIKLLNNIKIIPYGSKAFMKAEDGIRHVREELFAFQVETSSGYKWITETYTEAEKCQLVEIEAYTLPALGIPITKNSPFKELFAQRLTLQRSAGLISVWKNRWVIMFRQCAEGASSSTFKSIAFQDFWPALSGLLYGAIAAVSMLLLETIYSVIFNRFTKIKE